MNLHVDLGQIIISVLITVIGWLIKNEVSSFRTQLTRHEEIILGLVGDVQRLIGQSQYWNGRNRRNS